MAWADTTDQLFHIQLSFPEAKSISMPCTAIYGIKAPPPGKDKFSWGRVPRVCNIILQTGCNGTTEHSWENVAMTSLLLCYAVWPEVPPAFPWRPSSKMLLFVMSWKWLREVLSQIPILGLFGVKQSMTPMDWCLGHAAWNATVKTDFLEVQNKLFTFLEVGLLSPKSH